MQVSTSDPEEKTEKPSSMDVDKPVSAAPDSSGDNVNEPGQSADAKTAPAGIINQCLTVDHTMPGRGGSVASSDARSLYGLQLFVPDLDIVVQYPWHRMAVWGMWLFGVY